MKRYIIVLFLFCFIPILSPAQDDTTKVIIDSNSADGVFINPPDADCAVQFDKLDRRLEILEGSRDDLGSWIKIFMTSVSILIALNIGVSVWQIGSMARKEVTENIEGLHDQINKLIEESEKQFDAKVSDFNNTINSMLLKIEHLDKKADDNIGQTDSRIDSLKKELNEMLAKYREETNTVKDGAKNRLEKWYEKKIK